MLDRKLFVIFLDLVALGGKLSVTLRSEPSRELLTTIIADTGHGIAEDNIGRIFDPFFTTKNQELNGVAGTGLGLSVSYGIIQNHGGQISVQSTMGKGTIFTVELPVYVWKRQEFMSTQGRPLSAAQV